MGILFNRRLQQPLEGANGLAFSIFSVGREATGHWAFSPSSSAVIVNMGASNLWNMSKSSLQWHFHRNGWGVGGFSEEVVNG